MSGPGCTTRYFNTRVTPIHHTISRFKGIHYCMHSHADPVRPSKTTFLQNNSTNGRYNFKYMVQRTHAPIPCLGIRATPFHWPPRYIECVYAHECFIYFELHRLWSSYKYVPLCSTATTNCHFKILTYPT